MFAATRLGMLGHAGFFANEGFVNFYNATKASQRAIMHTLTDAVCQEPCGVVGDAQNAMQLVAADALLAGYHQVNGLKP